MLDPARLIKINGNRDGSTYFHRFVRSISPRLRRRIRIRTRLRMLYDSLINRFDLFFLSFQRINTFQNIVRILSSAIVSRSITRDLSSSNARPKISSLQTLSPNLLNNAFEPTNLRSIERFFPYLIRSAFLRPRNAALFQRSLSFSVSFSLNLISVTSRRHSSANL